MPTPTDAGGGTTSDEPTTMTGASDDGSSETGPEVGCEKIDFLVVIDNTWSMADEQGRLQAAFPGFLDAVATGPSAVDDVHILVTDADAWTYRFCQDGCTCQERGLCDLPLPVEGCGLECTGASWRCGPLAEYFECGVTPPLECEDIIGAGITHPRGPGAGNAECNFSSGKRYIDNTEPDINEAFQCAAAVGSSSPELDEKPMEAMYRAVQSYSEAAACNEGWLRDDAILVVVFATDEDDDSVGSPLGWRQILVDAKLDNEAAVVVLGLFGDNDLDDPVCSYLVSDDSAEPDGARASPKLRQFMNDWGEQARFGSVCMQDYDAFFGDAAALVDETCAAFVPGRR